jgi:hypothetical protein
LANEPTRKLRSAAVDSAFAVPDDSDLAAWDDSLDEELLLALVS